MKTVAKPSLYNGFKVNCNISVKHYIERMLFTEVYRLSNEQYLYLFTNVRIEDIVNKKHHLTYITVNHNKLLIPAVITNNHSIQYLSSIIDDLTKIRGLDCVAGMEKLKDVLINDVINPHLYPEKYKKFKLTIPNGILLYGPPGCGKTFIVKQLAEEINYL